MSLIAVWVPYATYLVAYGTQTAIMSGSGPHHHQCQCGWALRRPDRQGIVGIELISVTAERAATGRPVGVRSY